MKEREYIPRVYGASPAIVFDPLPPIASVRRFIPELPPRSTSGTTLTFLRDIPESQASIRKPYEGNYIDKLQKKFGYAKTRNILIMQGIDCDHSHGYDDGEWQQPRQ